MTDIIPLSRRRAHAAKFWICPNGHTEPFVAFEDIIQPGSGHAARACRVCQIGMTLASWHFDKAGQLIETSVRIRKVEEIQYDRAGNPLPKPIIRRVVSPRAVIRRLLRRLPQYEPVDHYRTDKVNGIVTLRVSRKGELTFYKDDLAVEKRHIVITSGASVPMAVTIELVGVFGWLQDVKLACKKSKLHLMLVMSRECDVLPPLKVIRHRRLYHHRFANKYLAPKLAKVADSATRLALSGKCLSFEKAVLSTAKKFGTKLSKTEVKRTVKEVARQSEVTSNIR